MTAPPAMSLTHLEILAHRTPNASAVLAELANLEAILTLPTPTVHVVSDVHGEDVKLRQVIHNASGALRPLLGELLARATPPATPDELERLLGVVYYPQEAWRALTRGADAARRGALLAWLVERAAVVLGALARRYTIKRVDRIVPDPYDAVFRELIFGDALARTPAFLAGLIAPFVRRERDAELVWATARAIRHLAVGELIVAGDLGDRGPRLDKVIEGSRSSRG